MKPELAFAKIQKGKAGRFRPLKPGDIIEPGDIEFHIAGAWSVSDAQAGQVVKPGEAIVRLEFGE